MGVVHGLKEDNVRQPVLVDEDGRVHVVSTVSAPLVVTTDGPLAVDTTTASGVVRTADVTQSHSLTTSSQSAVLPVENGTYILQSRGSDAFIETASGSAPTVTSSAGGFSLIVFDAQPMVVRLEGDYIAWVGASGGTFVCTLVEAS